VNVSGCERKPDRAQPSRQGQFIRLTGLRAWNYGAGINEERNDMSEHETNRREFLVRALVGTGAIAGVELVPGASAQDAPHPPADHHGAFFNHDDAATVAAFCERLMPGAPGKAGAHEAGVLNYIDLALAGAYADLQDFYRRGLAQLDTHCRKTYNQPFVRLDGARQDEVIRAMEEGKATEFTWPTAQDFFNTLRTHTMEGMFGDPIYGGNKDLAGWKLVGFPGAQPIFTRTDMESKQAFTRAPITGV
jgi:gluconate 2-dehydrogenase gamma chain